MNTVKIEYFATGGLLYRFIDADGKQVATWREDTDLISTEANLHIINWTKYDTCSCLPSSV